MQLRAVVDEATSRLDRLEEVCAASLQQVRKWRVHHVSWFLSSVPIGTRPVCSRQHIRIFVR